MCKHTEFDECKCSCHGYTNYAGEELQGTHYHQPTSIHMVVCCTFCPYCQRNIIRGIAECKVESDNI